MNVSQAEALYQLQKVDLQIIQRQKRLNEIAAALEDSTVVAAAQSEVDAAQETLSPLRTRIKSLELDIQSNRDKAQASEDRLYSGTVKNPKEMQDIQSEVAALRRRADELEEQLLTVMVSAEEAEDTLTDRQNNLQTVTAQWEDEHSELIQERDQLQSEVEALKGDRERALRNVKPESLETYNAMRRKKGNQPVAPLRGASCGVCGMEQTVAIQQEVRSGTDEFVQCLNCGRILASAI